MGKYTNVARLSKSEQEELFIDFVRSVSTLHNSVEAANYIKDLLSEAEVLVLARRLQIARLLSEGNTYQQIHKITKASSTTIAKVHWWMNQYGEGYRTVIKRTESRPKQENGEWRKLKNRYPMYFWPQLLLEEVVKTANRRERRRLQEVIGKLKEKTRLSKDLEKILKNLN